MLKSPLETPDNPVSLFPVAMRQVNYVGIYIIFSSLSHSNKAKQRFLTHLAQFQHSKGGIPASSAEIVAAVSRISQRP
jgi:hypothetical protein